MGIYEVINGPRARFVGDVDGDGFEDFVVVLQVSRLGGSHGPANLKAVTVVYGGPRTGEAEMPLERHRQTRFRFQMGTFLEDIENGFFPGHDAVAAVGDVDSDGFSDFCISSIQWDGNDPRSLGRVLLIFGSDSLPDEVGFEDFDRTGLRFLEFRGDVEARKAGFAISEAGDLNGGLSIEAEKAAIATLCTRRFENP